MELPISIPANDYVQPTEVRLDLVQSICEYLIKLMEDGAWVEKSYNLRLEPQSGFYQLYLNRYTSGECMGFSSKADKDKNQIRITTFEMQAVFRYLQTAKYYIYGRKNVTTNEVSYLFSKKPKRGSTPAEKIDFTEFID